MHLVPTQDEVVSLLRRTGAIRDGHFEYPNGLHANEYMQVQLAMRYFQHAKILSVGLSRLLRANAEIRAMIPELSIVVSGTGDCRWPTAFAKRCARIRFIGRSAKRKTGHCRFRQYLEQKPGEKVLLVDDILRTGRKLAELKKLVESNGAEVVGLAVIIYQPKPKTLNFDPLPFYSLAKLDATYYKDAGSCDMCKRGVPAEKVWI